MKNKRIIHHTNIRGRFWKFKRKILTEICVQRDEAVLVSRRLPPPPALHQRLVRGPELPPGAHKEAVRGRQRLRGEERKLSCRAVNEISRNVHNIRRIFY